MNDKVYNLSNDLLNLKSKLLELDCDLKEYKYKLFNLQFDLKENSKDEKTSKIINLILYIGELWLIIIYFVLNYNIYCIIFLMTFMYSIIKYINILFHGSKKHRKLKKKNINLEIDNLEEDISILKDKISKLKELVKTKEEELLKEKVSLIQNELENKNKKNNILKQNYLYQYESTNNNESKLQMKLKL